MKRIIIDKVNFILVNHIVSFGIREHRSEYDALIYIPCHFFENNEIFYSFNEKNKAIKVIKKIEVFLDNDDNVLDLSSFVQKLMNQDNRANQLNYNNEK